MGIAPDSPYPATPTPASPRRLKPPIDTTNAPPANSRQVRPCIPDVGMHATKSLKGEHDMKIYSARAIVAAFLANSLMSAGVANAMPLAPVASDIDIIAVAGGCGPGFHRGPYGGCRQNYANPGAHACPRGYHIGPGGAAAATAANRLGDHNVSPGARDPHLRLSTADEIRARTQARASTALIDQAPAAAARHQLKSDLASWALAVSCAGRRPPAGVERWRVEPTPPPHSAMRRPSPPNQRPCRTALSGLLFELPGCSPSIGGNWPSAVQTCQNLRA